ncbi:MAG: CxxC-x17-CxxC domain-containing protein [Acidimicrobiales bacterium]|jgi:CxxC-x17-CxxC domain-containing protein
MNNFKGSGGFKKGGNKFGNKPKFGGGGDKRSGGGNKFGGGDDRHDRHDRNDRSAVSSEKFKATCSECHKSCEVPFKPSGDKPVYCSDCFTKRLSEEKRGGSSNRAEHTKPPREQRSPRHDASRGQNDQALSNMQRQLSNLEEKLNRILEIINPPMPSTKVALVVSEDTPKKQRKAKKVPVVKSEPKKVPRKVSAKKTPKIPAVRVPAKPAPKKVVTKKAPVKKVVKKVAKPAVKKKVVKKATKK